MIFSGDEIGDSQSSLQIFWRNLKIKIVWCLSGKKLTGMSALRDKKITQEKNICLCDGIKTASIRPKPSQIANPMCLRNVAFYCKVLRFICVCFLSPKKNTKHKIKTIFKRKQFLCEQNLIIKFLYYDVYILYECALVLFLSLFFMVFFLFFFF